MLWILLLSLILVLPLLGILVSLLFGRFLPKRGGLLLAAMPIFLVAVAIVVLIPLIPQGEDLAETVAPSPSPILALQVAPTSRWVQPPRTLTLPTATAAPATITPTVAASGPPTATPHPYSLATVVVRNGTGETGLATRTSRQLATQGFRVLDPEDDPQQGNRPHTLILDRGDHPTVRQALADLLHIVPQYVTLNAGEDSKADIILILGDDFNSLANATPVPTPAIVGGPTATPNPYAGVTIIVRNGTVGRAGLATRTADRLKAQGFVVIDTADDDRAGLRPHTLLFDQQDHTVVREALIRVLGIDPNYVTINSSGTKSADIVIILGDDFKE